MIFFGSVMLMAAIVAIVLMIYKAIDFVLREVYEEKAEEMAEEKFEKMLETAEVHVVQRLEIVDKMHR